MRLSATRSRFCRTFLFLEFANKFNHERKGKIMLITVIFLILFAVIPVVICHSVAKRRSANPIFWGIMGAMFGPFALPFVFFLKKQELLTLNRKRAQLA